MTSPQSLVKAGFRMRTRACSSTRSSPYNEMPLQRPTLVTRRYAGDWSTSTAPTNQCTPWLVNRVNYWERRATRCHSRTTTLQGVATRTTLHRVP